MLFFYFRRRKEKKPLADGKWRTALIIAFDGYAFLVAFAYAFTGEFLFEDGTSASLAMGIAALSIFSAIKAKLK